MTTMNASAAKAKLNSLGNPARKALVCGLLETTVMSAWQIIGNFRFGSPEGMLAGSVLMQNSLRHL